MCSVCKETISTARIGAFVLCTCIYMAWDAYLKVYSTNPGQSFHSCSKVLSQNIAVKYAYLRYVFKCLCCICKYLNVANV